MGRGDRGLRGGSALQVLPVGVVVFLVGLGNSSSSLTNNFNIALLQCAFLLYSLLIFRGSLPELRRTVWMLSLVGCSMAVSNLLATWDAVGLADWRRVFDMMAHGGFALAFFFWLGRNTHSLHWIVWALLFAVIVYFLVLLSTWVRLDDPVRYPWFSAVPLFRHIRHLGYFLCIGVVIASWAVLAYTGWWRGLAWGAYLLAMSMLLWSGGRGAFLAACGGVVILLLTFPLKKHLWVWSALFVGMLLAFLFSALFQVDDSGLGWLSAVYRSSTSNSIDQLSSSRITIWMYLLTQIAERPWFGWGGEGFSAVWTTPYIVQAHNGLLQLLIEWGTVGTLLIGGGLLWLSVHGMMLYWRSRGRHAPAAELTLGMSLVTALLLLSLVDGVFYHGTPMAFLMIGYAMVALAVYRARLASPIPTSLIKVALK